MQNRRRFSSIIMMILSVPLFAGCFSRPEAQNTVEIQTLPATVGSIHKDLNFVGNVTSAQTSTLVWQTTGVIEQVNVGLGDTVSKGDTLAVLEAGSLSASVINAEIPLLQAIDQLEDTMASETPKAQAYKDLKDKEAELAKAESMQESLKYPHATVGDIAYWAEQVEISREFYEEALDSLNGIASWKHSPSESERNLYESKRKSMLSALSKYAETYNNYLYYSQPATENQIAQAAADIDTAEAAYEKALQNFRTYATWPRQKDIAAAELRIDNAQKTYDRRSIIADISGTVTAISARPGDYTTRNTQAFRIDNTEHLYIPLEISEIDIPSIHDGMDAKIVPDANTKKTYSGVITTIPASGDSSGSRVTFQTLIEILDPDPDLKIGMTAEVSIVIGEAHDVLLVPSNAVFSDNGTYYVTLYNGTSAYDIPVTIGLTTPIVTQITGGFLQEGDPVVVPSIDNSILEALGLSRERPTTTKEN